MSETTLNAALDRAERVKRGETDSYEPYLVALAEEVERLREENSGLVALASLLRENIDVAEEIVRVRDKNTKLSDAVGTLLLTNLDAAGTMMLDQVSYRVITAHTYARLLTHIEELRKVMEEIT